MREIKFRALFKHLATNESVWLFTTVGHGVDTARLVQISEWLQYTGLSDKNGVEIYEGDVLKGIYYPFKEKHRWIGKVEFRGHGFTCVGVKQYSGHNIDFNPLFEVIGNIYEDGHLLDIN